MMSELHILGEMAIQRLLAFQIIIFAITSSSLLSPHKDTSINWYGGYLIIQFLLSAVEF